MGKKLSGPSKILKDDPGILEIPNFMFNIIPSVSAFLGQQ